MHLVKRDNCGEYDYYVTFFNVFLCAALKYKKMLVFSSLVLKHFIIGNGTTQNNNGYSSFLVAGWLDPSHCSNSVFIIWWFWCTLHKTQVSDLWENNKQTLTVCKQTVSLQLSNICTAASRIPLFIFFSPQTILIQNIYRNPQNSAQTADGSHCKSHSWRNFFKRWCSRAHS